MKAVMLVPRAGGATVEIQDRPVPVPAATEVLVEVRAAGVNRGELAMRAKLETGAPQANGIEFAGEVVALGSAVSTRRIGDRVMGHWRGGQAEFVTADERLLLPMPERLSWVQGGAWLNAFVTAHDAIVTAGAMRSGESLLVTAATSSVGIAALQIARLRGAHPVLGSSRSPARLTALRAHGLELGLDATAADFAARAMEATRGDGVDVIIDNVGAEALQTHLKSAALGGRIVSVGRLGATVGTIDLDLLSLRRISLVGVTFRTRSLEQRIACVQRCAQDLLPALADGRLEPVVDRSFPIDRVAEAHELMAADGHLGKLVLTMN